MISELRSNYRLRIGLVLVMGILWLSWLLDLRNDNGVLMDQYKLTEPQLARFSRQQKQTQWLARAQEAKSALAAAETRIWKNPSLGLTQAEMQDWLLQQLLQAKATQYTVKISEPEGGVDSDKKTDKANNFPPDLIKVRAKLEFSVNPEVLNHLLSALATADHQIVVESLIVKQPRTELTVVAWYKLLSAAPVHAVISPANAR